MVKWVELQTSNHSLAMCYVTKIPGDSQLNFARIVSLYKYLERCGPFSVKEAGGKKMSGTEK